MANSNRGNNTIESIKVNGSLSSNPIEIKEHMVQFYTNLFTESCGWRPLLEGLSMQSIEEENSRWLERDFEIEVFEVVRHMKGDKSPSPYGFSMGFIKACSRVIKEDFFFF